MAPLLDCPAARAARRVPGRAGGSRPPPAPGGLPGLPGLRRRTGPWMPVPQSGSTGARPGPTRYPRPLGMMSFGASLLTPAAKLDTLSSRSNIPVITRSSPLQDWEYSAGTCSIRDFLMRNRMRPARGGLVLI